MSKLLCLAGGVDCWYLWQSVNLTERDGGNSTPPAYAGYAGGRGRCAEDTRGGAVLGGSKYLGGGGSLKPNVGVGAAEARDATGVGDQLPRLAPVTNEPVSVQLPTVWCAPDIQRSVSCHLAHGPSSGPSWSAGSYRSLTIDGLAIPRCPPSGCL